MQMDNVKGLLFGANQLPVLVIGHGSIGQRHARLLTEAGAELSIVSSHLNTAYRSIKQALESRNFEYVIVANQTTQHVPALHELAELGYSGKVLVEKPLSDQVFDDMSAACRKWKFEKIGDRKSVV